MELMMNIFINMYSLSIAAIMLFQLKSNDKDLQHRHQVFIKMLELGMLLLIIDIGSRFDGNPGTYYEMINQVSNFLMFTLNPLYTILWVIYIKTQITNHSNSIRLFKRVFSGVFLSNFILVVMNVKTHWFYSINEANVYERGPYFFASILATIVLMAFSYYLILRNRGAFTKKYFYSLLCFGIPPMLCIWLQLNIYGTSLVLTGIVISQLIVFFNIQNQRIYTDFLTGVYNRKKLESYLSERIERAHKKKNTFSAILLDLDDFKNINDTLGHDIGDNALEAAAEVLKNCVRVDDVIARYGGDEFCIIMNISEPAELEAMAIRIRAKIAEYNEQFNNPYQLRVSMGYAIYDHTQKMSADEFQRTIDLKMYQDKKLRKAAFAI